LYTFYNQISLYNHYPLISSFETHFDYRRWQASKKRSMLYASHGNFSMEVELRNDADSQLELSKFPRNWSHYKNLCFDIYNPANSHLQLIVRIKDYESVKDESKVHQTAVAINPYWNHLCIPIVKAKSEEDVRELNVYDIRRIIVSSGDIEPISKLYTDNWRLQ